MISGTFKIFLFSEPDFEAIFLEKGALSDFDFHFFSDTMGPSFVPPVHFWRSPFSISIHFLAHDEEWNEITPQTHIRKCEEQMD